MGLDIFIFQTTKRAYLSDFEIDKDFAIREIAYWRKNYELLDFFKSLFQKKGGEGDFNMQDMVLTEEDIKETMKQPFITKYDKEMLEDALQYIENGRLVYFWAWW